MMTVLRRLWRGEIPLKQAFWTWTVVGALIVNGTATLGFLLLIMAEQPLAALIVNYAVSVPYNIIAGVGVWRAAARYTGDPQWAGLARIVSIAALVVLSLA
jgi:hypothetical protein